jgi:hypothetical protein
MDDGYKDVLTKDRTWQWMPVIGRDGVYSHHADGRVQTLDKGEHMFVIGGGHPSTRLDRLIITNDRDFVPKDE